MRFLAFENGTGMVETTFSLKNYQREGHMIGPQRPYLLAGKV
jgi:hypothetical protein